MNNSQILQNIDGVLKIRVVGARSDKRVDQVNKGDLKVVKYLSENFDILTVI